MSSTQSASDPQYLPIPANATSKQRRNDITTDDSLLNNPLDMFWFHSSVPYAFSSQRVHSTRNGFERWRHVDDHVTGKLVPTNVTDQSDSCATFTRIILIEHDVFFGLFRCSMVFLNRKPLPRKGRVEFETEQRTHHSTPCISSSVATDQNEHFTYSSALEASLEIRIQL